MYHNKGEEKKLCLDDEVFWNIVGSREKLLLLFWQEGQKYMLFNCLVQPYYFEFDFWHLKNAGNRNLHNFDSKPFQKTKDIKISAIKKMIIG